MPWKEENMHIHIHTDNKEVVCLLKEIISLLKNGNGNGNDEAIKQEILDGLNRVLAKVKKIV